MHLLAVQPGDISDGSEAVDLGQKPGDIVVLSAADTDLASLAHARGMLGDDFPSLRLANFLQIQHNLSVDLYVENVIEHARLVCIRLLGGTRYWPYGFNEIRRACEERNIPLAIVPGDEKPDAELRQISSVKGEDYNRLWTYLAQGGIRNATGFLKYAALLIGETEAGKDWFEPAPLPPAGLYWPGIMQASMADIRACWIPEAPVVVVTFYRALVQSGSTAAVDALVEALRVRGLNPLPVFVSSLKDDFSAALLSARMAEDQPSVIMNMTSFAVSRPGMKRQASVLEEADCPIIQVILSSQNESKWRSALNGLAARDIAMNVALPEVDGRIISRAIAFKAETRFDALTQCSVVEHRAVPDRVDFVVQLAANWCHLRATPPAEKRLALVLANYPNRDGRIGNGVGLDTPQSVVVLLRHLLKEGYAIPGLPESGQVLMQKLLEGPTNAGSKQTDFREDEIFFPLSRYETLFRQLPVSIREAVTERWGMAVADPFIVRRDGEAGFLLPCHALGNIMIGIQPARGYNIDPKGTYHDPDLVPPHSYFAFYAFLRKEWGAKAFIHMGKHGTLEWLPGKSIALSDECFSEAVFGPLPHFYPFIVNDPGEGTQAKRRAQAVIIDHMTPPLTRAESYGPLKQLEALVDEYYEAANIDPRRMTLLKKEILELARVAGVDKDCGFREEWTEDEALGALDNYLCELKEMQIRNGLHVFGVFLQGELRRDMLVALLRTPRGMGAGHDASILRALAKDLGLVFDPLDCELGAPCKEVCPEVLMQQSSASCRTHGDMIERMEKLVASLVTGDTQPDPTWKETLTVLDHMRTWVEPTLDMCGDAELAAISDGLCGKFVLPGPSGAPTRGRLEVLPTGRNFYSVDTRAVPTQTAWTLGWRSAQLLVEDYRQRHGRWPTSFALSAWGTANMRTGGDDIAQALALVGVRPRWELSSGRVTGFEILPLAVLGRPRVDVTFRISGFFRDAFPDQIDLLDSAFRAVMQLDDETEEDNPLAARFRREVVEIECMGVSSPDAANQAGSRVFGSKPGAYGAGLQTLIDEGIWSTRADIADAYLEWGGYAYGNGAEGTEARSLFEGRLSRVEAVIQNQDNREHDLLDSDDYYQFEGGLASAIMKLRGEEPVIYHNDHSRPEMPRIRLLSDEIGRIVRARAANPKWITSIMRHGYKGAFEMAATVDYLFAFSASTSAVSDHHFDMLFDAYLGDEVVRDFMQQNNPDALQEMALRFDEALQRGLWQCRRNTVNEVLDELVSGRKK